MTTARALPENWFVRAGARSTLCAAAIILIVSFAAYYNSISCPFVFDDWAAIVENETIRSGHSLSDALSPPPNTGVTGRPLVNLTFAVNYAGGGIDPWGYHAVNLMLHALSGLALFGVVRRTLLRPTMSAHFQSGSTELALAAAALWAAHPLLTESVTCVIQRNEILAGLFYLLTLYTFIRSAHSQYNNAWRTVAVIACGLGMASKEVVVSAPLIVLLYDRTFVAGTFYEVWRQRWRFYCALASTWILLALLMFGSQQRGGTVGFGLGVGAAEYALTQCRAIALYLKLMLWPQPLVLDYGNEVVAHLTAVAPQAILLVLLGGGTLLALHHRPVIGFVGSCFFALLAPSSSVVPLTTQTIAEHRVYLPLAAVLVLAATGTFHLIGRRSRLVWVLAAAGFAVLTIRRTTDYRSELAIWNDTVSKRPANARARNNLGLALLHASRAAEAQAHYIEALRLDPNYSPAQANLGDALLAQGRPTEAILHYKDALQISPDYAQVHYNLGNALSQLGLTSEAITHYTTAVRLAPNAAAQHHALGVACFKSGRISEAIEHFEEALRLRPDYVEACNNLGTALLSLGKLPEAKQHFEKALRLQPGYARARANLERLQALEPTAKPKN